MDPCVKIQIDVESRSLSSTPPPRALELCRDVINDGSQHSSVFLLNSNSTTLLRLQLNVLDYLMTFDAVFPNIGSNSLKRLCKAQLSISEWFQRNFHCFLFCCHSTVELSSENLQCFKNWCVFFFFRECKGNFQRSLKLSYFLNASA